MIILSKVSKIYETRAGEKVVLNKVNLKITRGQKLGILGRNGSGKSTLIRIISGVELPTQGTVHRTMTVSWPLALSGGFQGSLTGLDNLRFISRIYGEDYASLLPFVEDFAEIGRYLREPLKTYSSGMRARLAFAISVAVKFDCFLIDEVIAVGDERFRRKCQHELFGRLSDRAIVIVSHELHHIREHCQTLAVLEDGHLSEGHSDAI